MADVPDSDLDELPELTESESGDASPTIDYRSDRKYEDDFQEEWHALDSGELSLTNECMLSGSEKDLRTLMEEVGTKAHDGPTECLDGQNGEECWLSTEPDMHHLRDPGGELSLTDLVEVQLSPQMSLLMTPTDGDVLPQLIHKDDYYVVRCYPSGVKRTVVERENNVLSRDEALQHDKACNQAMFDELEVVEPRSVRALPEGACRQCH